MGLMPVPLLEASDEAQQNAHLSFSLSAFHSARVGLGRRLFNVRLLHYITSNDILAYYLY
jgi:hypothetical protein